MDLLLDLKSVSRSYGTVQALRDVTIQLPPGRIGLLGPNGAGKSTLLKILLGLLPPSSGEGTVLNQDVRTAGANLRRLIGYVPEQDCLIPGMKGFEHVSLAGELCGMSSREARRRAHEVLCYLELEEARYRNVEEYSTGMKQRIKLAQALIHDPPILLLDEPTSGLDPAGRDAMLRLLLSLAVDHDKSLILSTHLLSDVERCCDLAIILHQGEVLRAGAVRDLCSSRRDRYFLQVEGDLNGFIEELKLEGVTLIANNGNGEIQVATPEKFATRAFFVLAENHGAKIISLKPDNEAIEELFHRMIREHQLNGAGSST